MPRNHDPTSWSASAAALPGSHDHWLVSPGPNASETLRGESILPSARKVLIFCSSALVVPPGSAL